MRSSVIKRPFELWFESILNTIKVTGVHVPDRKSPKVPTAQLQTGSAGSITTSPSPAKNQPTSKNQSVEKMPDRLSKPPDMKAWRQAQESLKTIDYEKQSQSQSVPTTPKPVPKPAKKTTVLSKEPDAPKPVVPPTQKSIIPTRKAKSVTAKKPVAKPAPKSAPVPETKKSPARKTAPVVPKITPVKTTTPVKPSTLAKTTTLTKSTTPVKTTAPNKPKVGTPKQVAKPTPKRAAAKVIAASRRERSPTPKRASPEIDDERVYDVDRQIPTDALREPEEISSDESSAEKNFDEDDPATWCITDDFIDLT